jgi:hypothetical protein
MAAESVLETPLRPPLQAPVLGVPSAVATTATARRDVALDLLRGLAMVILVVNHTQLDSVLETATRSLLSAAEVLVCVSGVAVGMVFGRRWRTRGARATTTALLLRARTLYLASVTVVAAVGALRAVPGLATDALTVAPWAPGTDRYDASGATDTLLAIVTLGAGPWQFSIMGFFVAVLVATPVVLWALARGWWAAVLAASAAAYLLGRASGVELLPSASEAQFPIAIWQVLYVPGIVLGWHRETVVAMIARAGGAVAAVVVGVAIAVAYARLQTPLAPEHFDKTTLDPARILTMVSIAAAVYLGLRRWEPAVTRLLGWALLPLGRSSFYVFITHVFVCLAVASVPAPAGGTLGHAGGALVQLGCLALLVVLCRRQVLFRWIPR